MVVEKELYTFVACFAFIFQCFLQSELRQHHFVLHSWFKMLVHSNTWQFYSSEIIKLILAESVHLSKSTQKVTQQAKLSTREKSEGITDYFKYQNK